ncbi:hypothetical protein DFJ73DRAFT_874342 [Zopfochytrium polystomum]|nr:hypothetical protein DFJ73DRAFT_874342 [Zopfochytrium polystomum]
MTTTPSCWGALIIRRRPAIPNPPDVSFAAVSLAATATLVDAGARVVISQTFVRSSPSTAAEGASAGESNKAHAKKSEAVYMFPLPENAAVCGFECISDDGTVVRGIAKEKAEARQVYDAAVSAGESAGLLEQHKADVFQVSVGNLRGNKVTTRITYIQELMHNNESDEVRFSLLSKNLQDRYGDAPTANTAAAKNVVTSVASTSGSSSSLGNAPNVTIKVEMSQPIQSIQSPSHTSVTMNLGTSSAPAAAGGAEEPFNPCRALVNLDTEANSYLDREMVLVVKSKNLDQPRCVLERHPVDGTYALGLTMVPRFALNEIRTEIVVLVDRSGSMSGSKIESASKALHLLLRSMPNDVGLYFNIIGFGSSFTPLFPTSVEYTESTLKTAEKYVSELKADMGGTELQAAFEAIFEKRRKDMPTQIFVLTDGEIWNVDSLFAAVDDQVKKASAIKLKSGSSAFVRIFTLGIGQDVSHNLVEGMARHGGGFAQFVVNSGEKLQPKVIKMLKAALMPPVEDYRIDWTGSKWTPPSSDSENNATEAVKPTISLFGTTDKPKSVEKPAPKRWIQPAPFVVPTLWPGARFTSFAILDASIPAPTCVKIKGTSADGPLELEVPVSELAEPGEALHTLAARKLIQDLEEKVSFIDSDIPAPESVRKGEIVRIGVKYGLASKHTSFVAVEDRKSKQRQPSTAPEGKSEDVPPQYTPQGSENDDDEEWESVIVPPAPLEEETIVQEVLMDSAHSLRYMDTRVPEPKAQRSKKAGLGGMFSGFAMMRSSLNAAPPPPAPMKAAMPVVYLSARPTPPAAAMACAPPSAKPFPSPLAGLSLADEDESHLESTTENVGGSFERKKEKGDKTSAPGGGGRPLPTTVAWRLESLNLPPKKEIALTDDARLDALVGLQQFDGSFGPGLASIAGWLGEQESRLSKALADARSTNSTASGVGDVVLAMAFACALAVVGLEKRLAQLQDEWELMAEKAKKFAVGKAGKETWDWLIEVARTVVV